MSIVVDIILVAFIVLGVFSGMKKGLIKSLVSLIGLVAVVILSWSLKNFLAEFLIDKLPFFNFSGSLEGLSALNILIYNMISFVVLFVLFYCILNIIISVTGFIDTLLKFTVIWVIPSKIGGAIIGFIEAWVFLFVAVFVVSQFSFANVVVRDTKITNFVLQHTPVIGTVLGEGADAAREIYEGIETFRNDETKTTNDLNLYILQIEINYDLISKEKATELMEIGKIGIDNVMFGKGESLWLNI